MITYDGSSTTLQAGKRQRPWPAEATTRLEFWQRPGNNKNRKERKKKNKWKLYHQTISGWVLSKLKSWREKSVNWKITSRTKDGEKRGWNSLGRAREEGKSRESKQQRQRQEAQTAVFRPLVWSDWETGVRRGDEVERNATSTSKSNSRK